MVWDLHMYFNTKIEAGVADSLLKIDKDIAFCVKNWKSKAKNTFNSLQ